MTSSYLSPAQVSEILGVSEKTLATWRCKKRGPAYIRLGKILYREVDIKEFLDSRIVKPEPRVSKCRKRVA
ncbi:helix-turn-helix domain-containing protein [Desulfovibrio falkowii]|uniref:helix-turn-helix domain-containing protein n=1 Tax=Desulfovibrio sp. WGS1351 TaxID=3366814 RepID=UPI00372D6D58